MKKKAGFFLRLFISIAAAGLLCYTLRGKFGEAVQIMKQGFRWEWFTAGAVMNVIATALVSWRLQLVFKVQTVKLSFLKIFYLSFVGMFFTLFFPSAFGGDVAKGYFAYQYSGKKLGSLTAVLLDRLLGLVTLTLITFLAVISFSRELETIVPGGWLHGFIGLLIGLTAFVVFSLFFFANRRFAKRFQFLSSLIPSAKLRKKLADLDGAIRDYKNHKQLLVSCCMISLVAQFLFLAQNYFLARSLGIQISFWSFFILMPLVTFVSLAPSLSGLGVREAGFVFFFKSLIPSEQAFALSLLFDLVFYGSALGGGIVFAFRGGLKKEVLEGLQAVEEQEA